LTFLSPPFFINILIKVNIPLLIPFFRSSTSFATSSTFVKIEVVSFNVLDKLKATYDKNPTNIKKPEPTE